MTKKHLRHTVNHRDPLGLFRSRHRRCSAKKGVLKTFAHFTGKHLCWSLLQACNVIKFAKFAKYLRTSILKNICERLILFNSPQNTSGEFGLDETLTDYNQMQPYHLYINLKNVSLTFQLTFLLIFCAF